MAAQDQDTRTYGIAEIFAAPQGEGVWVGTLMVFIRLAGCTVGKPMTDEERAKFFKTQNIMPYQETCTLYDGRKFACDTNFGVKWRLKREEILKWLRGEFPGIMRVCLTGGEPLAQRPKELIKYLNANGYKIHLETSGTVPIEDESDTVLDCCGHIAVSPKAGFLAYPYVEQADEFKLLVDENFAWEKVPPEIIQFCQHKTFLQPVNYEHTVNEDNIKRCLELQRQHPQLRISLQSHKLWHTR